MEFLSTSTTTILALALSIYFLLLIAKYGKRKAEKSKSSAPPEAAGAWPVIGHLHLLGGSDELLHKTFGAMADKFGPIFMLKLGLHPAIVVSNWETAKECFTTNDHVFVNRLSSSISAELMGYNYAMFALCPYGSYWREVRKIATLELLSNHRLELLGHIRQSEVKTSIREIYDAWGENKREGSSDKAVLVEMKKWFGDLTLNIIVRMIAGKRFTGEEDQEEVVQFQKALRDFFQLMGVFMVSDALPFLRWLDLGGYEKVMKRTVKELDIILQKWLDEHKEMRIISGGDEVKKEKQDFMDVMLSILEGATTVVDHQSSYDSDTINKSTCLAMLAAGTDTTTVTLTWALSLLLNHPEALKKAQEELDHYVGKQKMVEESDMKNLVYLQAIIKETFRLYPAVPLVAIRESVEDCTVGGYHVPKGTRLVVNAWKIQRDPRVWSDPNEFRPERFLTTHKDVDFRGQHFELVPFGGGRRSCPGIALALRVIQLVLARLLHGFELETAANEPVDMSESFGLTNLKSTPLEVLVTPRLSSSLYE